MSIIDTVKAITPGHGQEHGACQHGDLVDEALCLQWSVFRRVHTATTPSWIDCDLTIAQFKALLILASTQPMVIGQVSQQLGVGISTAGQLVDKLVQAGLAERVEDAEDRRRTYARLTLEGMQLYERLFLSRTQSRELLQALAPEDLAAFLQGLHALTSVLNERI